MEQRQGETESGERREDRVSEEGKGLGENGSHKAAAGCLVGACVPNQGQGVGRGPRNTWHLIFARHCRREAWQEAAGRPKIFFLWPGRLQHSYREKTRINVDDVNLSHRVAVEAFGQER